MSTETSGVRPGDGGPQGKGKPAGTATPGEYRARCLLALSVLRHRFDMSASDVIALERVLLGLDMESVAYGEPR